MNCIIQRATAKNPANRYDDVLEIAVAFRHETALNALRTGESLIEQLPIKDKDILVDFGAGTGTS